MSGMCWSPWWVALRDSGAALLGMIVVTLCVLGVHCTGFSENGPEEKNLEVLVDEKLDETLESLPLLRGTPKF